MLRQIYISCDVPERDLKEVAALHDFLRETPSEVHFAPFTTDWCGYRILEELIERADCFIAVIGAGYACSTWLNHELLYAATLKRFRFSPRPRIFGLRIPPHNVPRCSEQIKLEWLDETNRGLVLRDLPERG